ncbi:MAG: SRPBCC family protein [Candidatus Angelobacter sp.]
MKNSETLKVSTPTEREIVVTRVVDAPRHLVFEAWTNPKHLPRWLLGPEGWTMTVCEVDLRPGGKWHFMWRKSDGTEMAMHGVYKEVTPPERLVSIESWGGDWPETVNTLTLAEERGKTTITTAILYPSQEARDSALKTGMTKGMSISFDRLEEYLAKQAA